MRFWSLCSTFPVDLLVSALSVLLIAVVIEDCHSDTFTDIEWIEHFLLWCRIVTGFEH